MAKPNKDNSSAGFLDRFLEALYSFFRRFNKLFDRVVFNKAGSLIISLIASLVICIAIDYQDIRIELFNDTTTVVDLGNVNTEINLDQNKYEVSGIPSSVQVTLSGEETDIEVYQKQHPNLTVKADLSQYKEGSYIIDLALEDLPSTIKASISPETVTATITSKRTRVFSVAPEILIGAGQKASDFKTPTLAVNSVTIRATADELNAIRFVRAIVDVSGFTSGNSAKVNANVVAYDADGNRVQVEIDPTTIEATVEREDTE